MNILTPIFYNKFLLLILILFSTSCLQEPAKIINRSSVKFNKTNQFNQDKYRNIVQKKADKKDISSEKEIAKDAVIVQQGETLYSIAKKNGVPLRDLIDANNLEPPYALKAGSAIKIPFPNYHESREGETLYSISRMYDMKVNDVIALNNLKFPYPIYPGDKIKIVRDKNKKSESNEIIVENDKKIDNKKSEKNPQLALESKAKKENNIKPSEEKAKEIVEKKNSKEIEKYGFKPSEVRALELAKKNDSSRTAKNIINPSKNEIVETKLSINKPIDKDSIKKIANKTNRFSWPVRGEVISKFGPKSAGLYNDGINIKAPDGQAVSSSEDGIVAYVGSELKGYGNLVIVKHSGGWISAYAHLKNSAVAIGQKISKGQKIGNVGNSGKVKFPQLYFGLRKGRDAVNPENYL
jgi:murein DD-endopeptidase MepM/ murein hydrolase activator NlpD